jgi:hypothetical protein
MVDNADAVHVLRWADEVRKGKISVYTTADSADDVQLAVNIEWDGIGTFSVETLIKGEIENIVKGFTSGFTEELILQFEEQHTIALEPIVQTVHSRTITFELSVPNFLCPIEIARQIGARKAKAATPFRNKRSWM